MGLTLIAPDRLSSDQARTACEILSLPISIEISESDGDSFRLYTEAGEEHVFQRPYVLGDLVERIKQQIETVAVPEKIICPGGVFFLKDSRFVPVGGGAPVTLTEKETALILYLYHSAPEPVSKDSLLKKIWEYKADLETHTLETHIYRLRQKIESDPSNPRMIVTDEKGYSLSCVKT